MSWLDFFRKREETRKLAFQQLSSEVEAEIKRTADRIKNLKEKTRQRIMQLNSELEQEIIVLKKIDLAQKREPERLKFIVLENLRAYVSHLQNLNDSLKNLDLNDREYFKKIRLFFENFKRNSVSSVHKATILVGREIEDVIHSIKKFSADLEGIMAGDKGVFEAENTAFMLKNLLASFENGKGMEEQIKNSLLDSEKRMSELENGKKKLEKNLKDMRNSREFSEFLAEKEAGERKRKKIHEEIHEIRNEADIKSMLKHFHHDRKKSNVLSEYRENFIVALENDENLEIIGIIKEFRKDIDAEKLRELRLKSIELKNRQETAVERNIREIEGEIKKFDFEFSAEQEKIRDKKKKIERIKKKVGQAKEAAKKEAEKLWRNTRVVG